MSQYICPFTALSIRDTREDVERRLNSLRAVGVQSMNILWSGEDETEGFTPFNDEAYWTRIGWVAEICRREGMTFLLQDAAPFPTGLADGWLTKTENQRLNKLYLGERHLDVRGPNSDGAFWVDGLVGSLRGTDQEHGFEKARPFPGDRLYAVVAVRRDQGRLNMSSAVDLTSEVREGLLIWDVPQGIWRIFVIFETWNDGGRRYYINLLDPDSVALNIQAIYEPHCAHLKSEMGKTWLGFFYDETEIGNLQRHCVSTLPGASRNEEGESMALPWSGLVRAAWEDELREECRRLLPFLWGDGGAEARWIRVRYMDLISRILQETYNGQMHAWCRERGLQYIGHNLEDENTHCSLATGPVHFFRMQRHQDAAGIDLIAGQLMPGKDFPQSWFGCPEGDGAFYHYGLAKLASSAAHLVPEKRGRAFCEVFAVYGDIAGSRLRKYIYDHLMVNGINEMIPAPPVIPGAPEACSRSENAYVDRVCGWMHRGKPVIQAAVLYHAEAEWYGGDFQRFQEPGRELARNQISYDVIPADVFETPEEYQAEVEGQLRINGNIFQALIIPRTEALPAALARWLRQQAGDFPVFFCDRRPSRVAENGEAFRWEGGKVVPTNGLADGLSQVIQKDIRVMDESPDLRYAHFRERERDIYFLVNQGEARRLTVLLQGKGQVCAHDLMEERHVLLPSGTEDGMVRTQLWLDRWASVMLTVEKDQMETTVLKDYDRRGVHPVWQVLLEDGKSFRMSRLENIHGRSYAPWYSGTVIYEAELMLQELPDLLYLGEVYEIAEAELNGFPLGCRQCTPYLYETRGAAKPGKNHLRVSVRTGNARNLSGEDAATFGRSMSATVYNALPPGGLLGPVELWYAKEKEARSGKA